MIESIISNNCAGGAILHELGMEFKTPTINLQILPEQYPTFCKHLRYYMDCDLLECHNFTPFEERMLRKMFGGIPDMPFGLVGDIIVCFQHYDTFQEAEEKWNERKARVDYDHLGFIFHARGPEYMSEASDFLREDLPNKLCITENFTIPGAIALYPKDGDNAFSAVNGKPLITQAADYKSWRMLG